MRKRTELEGGRSVAEEARTVGDAGPSEGVGEVEKSNIKKVRDD